MAQWGAENQQIKMEVRVPELGSFGALGQSASCHRFVTFLPGGIKFDDFTLSDRQRVWGRKSLYHFK